MYVCKIEVLVILNFLNKTSLLKHEISENFEPFKEELTRVHLYPSFSKKFFIISR